MARILITGGAGFIGSHLADAHLARGDEVLIVDNLSSGKRENVPAAAEFAELDIRDPAIADLIRSWRPDLISHHAAQMDVRVSVADPRHDASVNIDGLLNVIQAASEVGIRRFVFVSSGGVVYGEPEVYPTPETEPKGPESPYGVSKLTGEYYLHYYHRVHGLDYVAFRYSNVYGPRQDPHGEAGVVSIFSTRLGRGEPLTVYGDGKQTRDYVHVADVVAANIRVADLPLDRAHTLDDRGFNVGTGLETSVLELAADLIAVSGREVEVTHAPARVGELQRSCLDAGKLRAHGWSPERTLRAGLRETYEWISARGAL